MSGRTSWWAKDAAWHRRELIVELGDEHGSEGPNVVDVLSSWAQEQRGGGTVRGGFRTLARESFVTLEKARAVVEMAAAIGVLDDLEIDPDGRRFTCRLSGWTADQERGRATFRKATQRDQLADVTASHGESRQVTPSALPDQTKADQEELAATPQRSRASQPTSRSLAETVACPRCGAPAGEKCDGARKKRESCHLERHHAVGELTHLTVSRGGRGGAKQPGPIGFVADPEIVALRDEHFPDADIGGLQSAAARLRLRRQPVTVDALRRLMQGGDAA